MTPFRSTEGQRRIPRLNWTSTKIPLWESDLISFWRAGRPFEVLDVTTPEQNFAVTQFAAAHELEVEHQGTTRILRKKEKHRAHGAQ